MNWKIYSFSCGRKEIEKLSVDKFSMGCTPKVLPLVYDDSISYYEEVCRLVNKINELVDALNNVSIDILQEANSYTDTQIDNARSEFDAKVREIEELERRLSEQYNAFTNVVNARIQFISNDVNRIDNKIDDEIIGANEYTNQAIKNNNEYLIEELSQSVSNFTVINYFTGEKITVQNMFDTLAKLHVQNPMTYDIYANKNISYSGLSLLNIDYTELVMKGNELIPQN